LKVRNNELEVFTASQKLLSNSLSLIEASKDPLVTININGQITGMNEATVKNYRLEREKLHLISLLILPNHKWHEKYIKKFSRLG
jgi:PAS domain-containing protein